jgi:hypothetical protein
MASRSADQQDQKTSRPEGQQGQKIRRSEGQQDQKINLIRALPNLLLCLYLSVDMLTENNPTKKV